MAPSIRNDARHYETIILGAGMAGLSCASRLFQNRHYQEQGRLLILEARDRIGGRIASVDVNGSRLDTGANWIHGIGTPEKPNPLMDILPHKRYREFTSTVMFQADELPEGTRIVENGIKGDEDWVEIKHSLTLVPTENASNKVIPTDTAKALFSTIWTTIEELHDLSSATPADAAKRTSMFKALDKVECFREAFKDIDTTYITTLSALPQFIENVEAAPLVAQSAEHPEDTPGMSLLEFAIDDFDGAEVFLQDGYIAIIREIASALLAAGIVETNTEVKQVRSSDAGLEILTSNGTYTASNVVCTLPLGVLKHHLTAANSGTRKVPFFTPPLPLAKQVAISSLGFGTLDKIFLVYSNPWWTDEPYASIIKKGIVKRANAVMASESPDSFTGFTTELPGVLIHEDGTTSSGSRIILVTNLHSLTGFPALSAFVSCSTATEIESMTDKQASDIMHRALTSWFGHEPPMPDAVHVTRWAQDEFSRGSYSHMITGISTTQHREEFQKPIVMGKGQTLRFAGEHTSRNHFATVHGALLSGWREADDILSGVTNS